MVTADEPEDVQLEHMTVPIEVVEWMYGLRLSKRGLSVSGYMKERWGVQIPSGVEFPDSLQQDWEDQFPDLQEEEKWPRLKHYAACDAWMAWERVLLAVGSTNESIAGWNAALAAADKIPRVSRHFVHSQSKALLGPKNRELKNREDTQRRLQLALDSGVRDKRKLAKIYRDSFFGQNNRPVSSKTLKSHIKAILEDG